MAAEQPCMQPARGHAAAGARGGPDRCRRNASFTQAAAPATPVQWATVQRATSVQWAATPVQWASCLVFRATIGAAGTLYMLWGVLYAGPARMLAELVSPARLALHYSSNPDVCAVEQQGWA
jgi:hypothetical protein